MKMTHRQGGFTVIELMIVLTVAAVILSVAVPTFETIVKNNRLYTQSNDFYLSLMRARSEALARVQRVTVCPANSGFSNCSGTTWENGWIVFVEDFASQNGSVDAGEDIILVQQTLSGSNTLRGSNNVASYVSYLGDGLTTTMAPAPQTGIFVLCDDRGISEGKGIRLNASGRPLVVDAATDAGITNCSP
ncbi:MAG: GspH/FimT family pseudopilin [Pseudomonadota bacterium]